ncbi:MAG: N-acetyltransferase family protein [Gemmatimonadales bacterium]
MEITGRWGRPAQVLLDVVADEAGVVRGIVNPGREHAAIRQGTFDRGSGFLRLEGDLAAPDGGVLPFHIEGRLVGRTLQLAYRFGGQQGTVEAGRVEDYRPPRATLTDRFRGCLADLLRMINARSRPGGAENRRALEARGESLDSIVLRDAVAADIPALAELHVTTWNATYRTTRGPSVEARAGQWRDVFAQPCRRDFVLVLEDRTGRLIGFVWGKPHGGEFEGLVSKIYLRWEYHGLGLGRRLMAETARRFLALGIRSCVLFAERTNPTIGFYDRMGGERLRNDRGLFDGAYGWRDLTALGGEPPGGPPRPGGYPPPGR